MPTYSEVNRFSVLVVVTEPGICTLRGFLDVRNGSRFDQCVSVNLAQHLVETLKWLDWVILPRKQHRPIELDVFDRPSKHSPVRLDLRKFPPNNWMVACYQRHFPGAIEMLLV